MAKQSLTRWIETLPIGAALPELVSALAHPGAAVLEAPPGAGKTTLVPLALRDAPWLGQQKIVMLEPRRLAARAAARRMAEMIGETVGETVGFRTRLETRIGPRTCIEVVTGSCGLNVRQQEVFDREPSTRLRLLLRLGFREGEGIPAGRPFGVIGQVDAKRDAKLFGLGLWQNLVVRL